MLIDHAVLKERLHRTKDREQTYLIGLDEVGRGPLIGDVVAAAVMVPLCVELDSDATICWSSVTDSKKLSEKRREALAEQIKAQAVGYAIGRASSVEIDRINILQASLLAMQRAVKNLQAQYAAIEPLMALVDGRHVPDLPVTRYAVIKGDNYFRSIGAASILAKVTRDQEMLELHRQYPDYGIAQHKGYPTKQHLAALEQFGPTPVHRTSFGPVRRLL